MSVIDFIEKLQRKPRHVRIQIMWAGVTVGAVVIFAFWLWSLTNLLSSSQKASQKEKKALQGLTEIRKEVPGLWQSLNAGISNVIDTARDDFGNNFSPAPSDQEVQPGIERLPIE